jgi:hypothetical protein
VQKPFGDGYSWIAAFQGNEQTGPSKSPTEAINKLVDITELTLRAASGSPAFFELKEVPS